MDFADQIKELAARLATNKEHVFTEEATKQSKYRFPRKTGKKCVIAFGSSF